jgi:hypothetical protein
MWAWIITHPGWAGMGAGFLIGLFMGWLVFALLVMAGRECLKPSGYPERIDFE